MNGRVLKLGALGALAVNLFFRGLGVSENQKSKIQNQTSKIIPRGLQRLSFFHSKFLIHHSKSGRQAD
jgi:hypothetical protein